MMDHFPTLATVATQGFDWKVMGSLLIGFLGVGGAVFAALVTRKNGREANAVTQVPLLWDRLDELEKLRKQDRKDYEKERAEDHADREKLRVTVTETAALLSLSIGYIEQLVHHFRSGGGEPLPTVPEQLRAWIGHLIHRQEH